MFDYRISEGVYLRADADEPVKLEAWGPNRKAWFVYPSIDRDWGTNSRPVAVSSVPPEARNAPSFYPPARKDLAVGMGARWAGHVKAEEVREGRQANAALDQKVRGIASRLGTGRTRGVVDITTPQEKKVWTDPPPSMPKNFADLSPAEKDKLADAPASVPARIKALTTDEAWPKTGSTKTDIEDRVAQCRDKIAPAAERQIVKVANEFAGRVSSVLGDTPEARVLIEKLTDGLMAQEVEAATRVLGDHGIAHLQGDLKMAEAAMAARGGMSKEDRVLLTLAAAFHDTGYLTPPSRAWQDGDHPRWSQQYFDAEIGPVVAKAFGADAAKKVSDMILTHADTDMDWDKNPLSSALRLADNIALFQREKTPPLLKYVPDNRQVLEDLAVGKIDVTAAKIALAENVEKSTLPEGVRSQLVRAVGEVTDKLPKFLGGMWSGEIHRIAWDTAEKAPI